MTSPTDRTELVLRASNRALMIVLFLVLLMGGTVIAHEVRPGSLLADWASRMTWSLPLLIIVTFGINLWLHRGRRPDDAEVEIVMKDEFRQANLARAQRVALIAVIVMQVPLAASLSHLTAAAAVMVMAWGTMTMAIATTIASFLYFDRG